MKMKRTRLTISAPAVPPLVIGIAVGAFLLLSNRFDWDQFHTMFEVDLRSWLVDHELPLWSHQFCAGAPRAGDPQSFGLSPLFVFPLLLGSFWGLKTLLLACFSIGWYFLYQTGLLLWRVLSDDSAPSAIDRLLISTLAATTAGSNYFLWHYHHGHGTFSLHYLLFGLAFYALKAVVERIAVHDVVIVTILIASYVTGGFYHSLIFFGLPLALSAPVPLFFALRAGLFKDNCRRLCWLAFGVALGLLFGAVRSSAVLEHQRAFPRTLYSMVEGNSVGDALLFQLLPTLKYSFLGIGQLNQAYGIWEYSSFNACAWITVLAVVAVGGRTVLTALRQPSLRSEGRNQDRHRKVVFAWLLALLVLAVLYSLPSDYIANPHRWINNLLRGSIRVTGRYQIVFTYFFFLAANVLFARVPELQKVKGRLLNFSLLAVTILNMATFNTLSFENFRYMLTLSSVVPERMNSLATVPRGSYSPVIMYPTILAGGIVGNCYNPLNRPTPIMSTDAGLPEFMDKSQLVPHKLYPLVIGTQSADCRKRSQVSQNRILLDPSCEPGTCLNLNFPNPRTLPSNLKWNPAKQRWCISEGNSSTVKD